MYQPLLSILQTFWVNNTHLISEGPGVSFEGKVDKSLLSCKWNHVVGDASVEELFTASSLEEQQEVFDSWPAEELRKQVG